MESPEHKVFVGGLSWDYTDRELEAIFRRYGKVLDAKVMIDRNTGRPRGFGFVTFADEQGMREAIVELHNRELEGRIVSVTKAQPRSFDRDNGYGGSDSYRGGGYGGGSSGGGGGRDECFKCGRVGHWARECPSGGGGGRTPRDRYEYSSSYGSDRYSERGRGRDSYGTCDRYGDGIGKSSHFSSGYGDKDRYGSGGPSRYERNSYRDRPTPYDRPSGRRSGYDDRY